MPIDFTPQVSRTVGVAVTTILLAACTDTASIAEPDAVSGPAAVTSRSVQPVAPGGIRDDVAASIDDAVQRLVSGFDRDGSNAGTPQLIAKLNALSAAIDRRDGALAPMIESVDRTIDSLESEAISHGERAELDAIRLAVRRSSLVRP